MINGKLRVFLVLVFGISVIALFSYTVSAQGHRGGRNSARSEIRFMQDMIDHHWMAIEMAELGEDRAVHQEFKDLCTNIISTQTEEIAKMQSWLLSWYGITYEPRMSRGDLRQMRRLEALIGEEFEKEFLKMMIMHHWMAVMMSSHVVDTAPHQELRELARSIIRTQSAEIEQMRSWLCDWYSICNYGPRGGMMHP